MVMNADVTLVASPGVGVTVAWFEGDELFTTANVSPDTMGMIIDPDVWIEVVLEVTVLVDVLVNVA